MGDRAHVVIKEGDSTVYLYTHWCGTELPGTVRHALVAAATHGRLTDAPYLARIVFCEMLLRGSPDLTNAIGCPTGFGISAKPCEDTSRDIIIDVDRQMVYISESGAACSIVDYIKGA